MNVLKRIKGRKDTNFSLIFIHKYRFKIKFNFFVINYDIQRNK